jgi:hypothetical protein
MPGAKFTAVPGLNEIVAQMCVPKVQEAAEEVARRARAHAPALKMWQTMEDAKVRHTHVKANKQQVPVNLRFTIKSMDWDIQHRGVGPWTYMLFPRDESSRALANLLNCRCVLRFDKDGVGKYVKTTEARAEGAKATAKVVAEGNLVVQAEYGDVYPFGNHSEGAFFMGRAAAEVQAMML